MIPFFEEENSEEELLIDKFDSIEDLNNYYKEIMSLKRLKAFKESIEAQKKAQAKVVESESTEFGEMIAKQCSSSKFSSEYLRELVMNPEKNKKLEGEQKEEIENIKRTLSKHQEVVANHIDELRTARQKVHTDMHHKNTHNLSSLFKCRSSDVNLEGKSI